MSAIHNDLVLEFASAFTGNMRAHGVFIADTAPLKPGEKRGGTSYTKKEDVGINFYKDHLEGTARLGIVPIREDATVLFSVIDVDVYDSEHSLILTTINKYALPLLPFRSKSGGLHLYIFYEGLMPAKGAIQFMDQLRMIFGLNKKTEIFPKQSQLNSEGVGNWINLPYYDADNTVQYLIGPKGEKLSLLEALVAIRKCKVSKKNATALLESLPLYDGPPCLQHFIMHAPTEPTSNCNNYLFSLARYYKSKYGDDYQQHVIEANNALQDPIKINELLSTIISSHNKREYSYLCNEEPLVSLCNKEECQKRKYGIGGDEISALNFEEFTQFNADPPWYEWKVNGVILKFYSEEDVINQGTFRALCMRYLNILPSRMKFAAWDKIVGRALKNKILKAIDVADDISSGAQFMRHLCDYLTKRVKAANKKQIAMDRVFEDVDISSYIFKHATFIEYLQQKQFKVFSQTQIQDRLRQLGGEPKKYYVDKEVGTIRVWALPFSAVKEFIDKELTGIEVDFMEAHEGEKY